MQMFTCDFSGCYVASLPKLVTADMPVDAKAQK